MLSIRDMLDYCDLDEGEIEAIAEHEHVPLCIAAEIGDHLLQTPEGVLVLHKMILENMEQAMASHNDAHVQALARVYAHLCRTHPLPAPPSNFKAP